MGSVTPEMTQKIRQRYSVLLSYSKVGKELGIDARTVKRHVENREQSQHHTPKNNSYENGTPFEDHPRGVYKQVSADFLSEKSPYEVARDPEYEKFKNTPQLDLRRFAGKLVQIVRDINHPWIRGMTDSYDTKGCLTEAECLQLVQYAISYKSNPSNLREQDLPKDWVAIPCEVCGRLAGAVDHELGQQLAPVFAEWKGWVHEKCEKMLLIRARAR